MIHWNASPEILSLGPLQIRWYGLLFATGFLLGYRLMIWAFQREKMDPEHLDSLLVYMIVGTVIGARLGHCLLYEPEIYLRDPIRILKIWEGGLASHGGGVGVLIAIWLWRKKYFSGSYLALLDYLTLPTILTGAMIRLGNFFNSEIVGMPSQVPWAVVFQRLDNVARHPAQLYESISYFAIFFVLLGLLHKGVHRGRRGLLFGLFLILVFSARFLIEFIKERQVAFEYQLPLDLGQLLSIPFILFGLYFFIRALRKPVA